MNFGLQFTVVFPLVSREQFLVVCQAFRRKRTAQSELL